MSFSQVQIIGNCGRDPEMSYTPDGTAVTKFSVAVTEKGRQGDVTTWFNCSAWRGLAEMLNNHLTKGSQVFVQGKLTVRNYTTKEGKAGVSLDVMVDKFSFAGGKQNGGAGKSQDGGLDELGDLDALEDHPF